MDKTKKNITRNILIITSFMIIAFAMSATLIFSKKYMIENDTIFHIKRIVGISEAIKEGNIFPHFNFWTTEKIGSAEDTFYPYLVTLPLILIFRWVKSPLIIIYGAMYLMYLASILISYYVSHPIIKSKKRRYLFALIYMASGEVIIELIKSSDCTMMLGEILLPIAFFGLLEFIQSGNWEKLSIGIILLAYTHILITIIFILFAAIMIIINSKKVTSKDRIKSLFKLSIVTALAISYQIIPMIYIMAKNKINMPFEANKILTPNIVIFGIEFGIAGIVGIISSAIHYKKLFRIDKQLFWIGLIFIMSMSKIVPWNLLSNTPIHAIQYSRRIIVIPILIFSYLLSKYIVKYNSKIPKWTEITLLLGSIIMMQAMGQSILGSRLNTEDNGNSKAIKLSKNTSISLNSDNLIHVYFKGKRNSNNNYTPYITNKLGIKKVLNAEMTSSDYLTVGHNIKQGSVKQDIFHNLLNKGIIHNKKITIKFKPQGNGKLKFKTNKYHKSLMVPIDKYNGINYKVILNGKKTKYYRGHNNFMFIRDVKPGTHVLRVRDENNLVYPTSAVISLIGCAGLLILKRKEY